MSRRTIPIWLFAALLGPMGCRPEGDPSPRMAAPPVAVTVATVTRTREPYFQLVAGTIRPLDHAVVAARVAGLVRGADFAIGQRVTAGSVLLTIQADELGARAAQARAALDQAMRDAARESELFARGASPGETAQAAQDRLRAARAAFEEAQTLLGYTNVTAPFEGNVTRKLVYTGDFAAPGTPLFEIETRHRMRVELAIPESLPALPLGETVRVLRGEQWLAARITEASRALDPVTRTQAVILEFPPGPDVRSGEFVRAQWPAGDFDTVRAPIDALRSVGQIERVFVVSEGKALLRIVKTGGRANGHVQVIAGLDGGERVIVSPAPDLRDGQAVSVAP